MQTCTCKLANLRLYSSSVILFDLIFDLGLDLIIFAMVFWSCPYSIPLLLSISSSSCLILCYCLLRSKKFVISWEFKLLLSNSMGRICYGKSLCVCSLVSESLLLSLRFSQNIILYWWLSLRISQNLILYWGLSLKNFKILTVFKVIFSCSLRA